MQNVRVMLKFSHRDLNTGFKTGIVRRNRNFIRRHQSQGKFSAVVFYDQVIRTVWSHFPSDRLRVHVEHECESINRDRLFFPAMVQWPLAGVTFTNGAPQSARDSGSAADEASARTKPPANIEAHKIFIGL